MVGVPDGDRRAGRLRRGPRSRARCRPCRAPRWSAKIEEHFRQGLGRSADLEAGARPALLGGRSAQDRQALGQAPRRRGGDCAAAPQDRGDARARSPSPAGERGQVALAARHRRDRVGAPARRRAARAAAFGELGFDSLMYAELSSALETAGVALPESVDVTTLGTRRRAAGAAGARAGGGGARAGGQAATVDERRARSTCPSAVSAAGKRGLALGAAPVLRAGAARRR